MKKGRVIWGVLLIVIAVMIIGSGLGILPAISIKMIGTVLLGAVAVWCLWYLEFAGVFFSLACLGIMHASALHIESITPFPILGAALLLSIGFSLLFGKQIDKRRETRRRNHHSEWTQKHSRYEHYRNEKGEDIYDTAFGEHSEQVAGEMLYFKNSFGESSKYVMSDDFKSAGLNNSFGELKVYFDNAVMQQQTATIDIYNSFGETQVFLPKEWNVDNKIQSMLGAVTENNYVQANGQHTVILTGNNCMGEVQIIYI